jgi:hypothetical protein
MANPDITIHDALTGVTETREMTDEEYSNHLEATSATPCADLDTGTDAE